MNCLITTLILLISVSANAAWVNTKGMVKNIVTYSHTETILVELSIDGTNVSECSDKKLFAVGANMTKEGRARMYSML